MRNPVSIIGGAAFAATVSVAAFTALASAPANAAENQSRGQQEAACRQDAFTYCQDAIPDAGKVEACLRRNKQRISQACQALLK